MVAEELPRAKTYIYDDPETRILLVATAHDAATSAHGLDFNQHIVTDPKYLPTNYTEGDLRKWCADVRRGILRVAERLPQPREHNTVIRRQMDDILHTSIKLEDAIDDDKSIGRVAKEFLIDICRGVRGSRFADFRDFAFELDAVHQKAVEIFQDYASEGIESEFRSLLNCLRSTRELLSELDYPWPANQRAAADRDKLIVSNVAAKVRDIRTDIEASAEDGRAMRNLPIHDAAKIGERIEGNADVQKSLSSGKSIDIEGVNEVRQSGLHIAAEGWIDLDRNNDIDPNAAYSKRLQEMSEEALQRTTRRGSFRPIVSGSAPIATEEEREKLELEAAAHIVLGREIPEIWTSRIRKLDLQTFNRTLIKRVEELSENSERALAIGPSADRVHVGGSISEIAKLHYLEELDLSGAYIMDLSPIASLFRLRKLHLAAMRTIEFNAIRNLTNLEDLDLSCTGIRDLTALVRLRKLSKFSADDTQVTDLSPLAFALNLKSLSLSGTPVDDLRPLSILEQLQVLNIEMTKVSDLAPLRDLKALMMVNADQTNVTDWSPVDTVDEVRGRPRRWTRGLKD